MQVQVQVRTQPYDTTWACSRHKWRIDRNRYDEDCFFMDGEFESHETLWKRVAKLEIDERVAYVDGVSALYDAIGGRALPARERVAGTRPERSAPDAVEDVRGQRRVLRGRSDKGALLLKNKSFFLQCSLLYPFI